MFCNPEANQQQRNAAQNTRSCSRDSLLSVSDRSYTASDAQDSPQEVAERLVQELNFWESPSQMQRHQGSERAKIESTQTKAGNSVKAGSPKREEETRWRKATDPNSGRIYYYDVITRKSQWEKPNEIKAIEKRLKAEKRRQDRIFFKEMERNIYLSLGMGERIPRVSPSSPYMMAEVAPKNAALIAPTTDKPAPQRVRTISGMHEVTHALAELNSGVEEKPRISTAAHHTSSVPLRGRPPLPHSLPPRPHQVSVSSYGDSSCDLSPEDTSRPEAREDSSELAGERLLMAEEDSPPSQGPLARPKPIQAHMRRNTGGTVFAKTTMTNPNIEATLKCVCGVYRAHILQATNKRSSGSPVSSMDVLYDECAQVFLDDPKTWKGREPEIPTLEQITHFYHDFFKRSQMEHDTIIMSLIYIERLIKESNIAPVPENWRSILLSCMVLASKVWDDLSMWNVDFSNVCGRGHQESLASFTLARINKLELALLKSLHFSVKVPAGEYAKYYFLIRTMLMKSGLLDELNEKEQPQRKPLDMSGAKTLEMMSTHYQESTLSAATMSVNRRSKSWSECEFTSPEKEVHTVPKGRVGPVLQQSVCLEQLVTM